MRTIYAEYNINHDSIDVYTSACLLYTSTERHILGETSQWAGNTDPAVLPYWLVWTGAEWDISFVPFYNGKDGNSCLLYTSRCV